MNRLTDRGLALTEDLLVAMEDFLRAFGQVRPQGLGAELRDIVGTASAQIQEAVER